MGRRRRGWYWSYIVRPATEKEAEFFVCDGPKVEPIMYWAGRRGDEEGWHDLPMLGHRFFLSTEAETEVILLVGRCPDLLGKLRVVTRFEPEPKEKRRRRVNAGGSAKAVGNPVHGHEPGGDVPPRQGTEQLSGHDVDRQGAVPDVDPRNQEREDVRDEGRGG